MTDLLDHVDSLKRLVAPPGEFVTLYKSATDDDLVGSLADGFAEAQLDGFFIGPTGNVIDVDQGTIAPDLSVPQARLVVLYATVALIQARLLNLKNQVRYEAKGAIYETTQNATILTTLLKQFSDRKAAIVLRMQTLGAGSAFTMADAYFIRATVNYVGLGAGYGGYEVVDGHGAYDPYGQP